jgi:hypothetical protein
MSSIIKYSVLIFSVFIIITLVVIYFGFGNKAIKEEIQKQVTTDQYRMSFNFEGDKSQLIDLVKGNVEIKLIYPGNSRFTAKLLHSDGTLLALLADGNGPYNREQVIDVPETEAYILDIKTSGNWSFSRK